jgi:hypothetical protein
MASAGGESSLSFSSGEVMTYFKSVLAGLATALIAVIIVVLSMLQVWMSAGSGSGDAGMYLSISSWQILLAAAVGFAVGFWLMLRRSRSRLA